MKKVIFLCLGVILISGCSNNENQELCDKIDEIDLNGSKDVLFLYSVPVINNSFTLK